MLLKNTMTSVAIELANDIFLKRCDELDNIIEQCFIDAFKGEKIGQERMKRISNRFCDLLLAGDTDN